MRISWRTQRRESHGAAVERIGTRGRRCSRGVKERITRLVVEVGNRASSWRAAATDAQLAFEWWKSAGQGDRARAADVYLAAIEREEKAASEYSAAVEACCRAAP